MTTRAPSRRISGRTLLTACAALALCAACPALLAQTAEPQTNAAQQGEPAPTDAVAAPEMTGSNPAQDQAAPATIDPVPPESVTGQSALDAIQQSMSISKERAEALRREIESYSGDRPRQNAELIAAAQRVQTAEIEVDSMEERLDALIIAEFEVRGRLDGADTSIANVLAALERISRNPPPALIVDPYDALGSARSAILMSAIFPQLQQKAAAVTADLERLTQIKAEAQKEEALLKANFAVLEEEQLRIATLIEARRQGVEVMTEQLAGEEQEALALAARATSLKELIDSLATRASAVASTSGSSTIAERPAGDQRPEAIRVALANTARTEPALPFANIKGHLTLPSSGVNVIDFGASDGFGGIASGISIVTRAEAQVVAPADGWVMYKGPYLNYGQIVILNTGSEYTVLLAGLEAVTVNLGQFVLMGEPVGVMGSRTIGRAVATSAGNSRPTLYIELRKSNEPIDPTGWWASPINTVQSG